MLKTIPALLTPDLLRTLAAMGHGDLIAIVDRNYPSETYGSRVVHLPSSSTVDTTRAILQLLPIDRSVEPAVLRMVPELPSDLTFESHTDFATEVLRAEGRQVTVAPVERRSFYELSQRAAAIVQTGETRPYSCFLVAKGVI